jgi:hypothetical protein
MDIFTFIESLSLMLFSLRTIDTDVERIPDCTLLTPRRVRKGKGKGKGMWQKEERYAVPPRPTLLKIDHIPLLRVRVGVARYRLLAMLQTHIERFQESEVSN